MQFECQTADCSSGDREEGNHDDAVVSCTAGWSHWTTMARSRYYSHIVVVEWCRSKRSAAELLCTNGNEWRFQTPMCVEPKINDDEMMMMMMMMMMMTMTMTIVMMYMLCTRMYRRWNSKHHSCANVATDSDYFQCHGSADWRQQTLHLNDLADHYCVVHAGRNSCCNYHGDCLLRETPRALLS